MARTLGAVSDTAGGPAVLGGTPAFPDGLPVARPSPPPLERVVARLTPSYDKAQLTTGPVGRELEEAAAERFGVRHAVAVSCCTAGLMLTFRVLRERGHTGPVVVPSFTFSASAHAVAWNGLPLRFAECDPSTFQLDVADAKARLDGGGAVLATHVFGAPCTPDAVERIGADAGVPVVFDAAHAFGASVNGRAIGGFGMAEVFSLSPTKLVVAGEGGIVATNDDDLAHSLRIGRDYGNPGDYDTRFVGLNARMSELHAALALESLAELDDHLADRRAVAERYRNGLRDIEGVRVQHVPAGDESTYKDFTIAIDADRFGLTRDQLVAGLTADGIDTRRYFSPPVHRQTAYAGLEAVDLPVTDGVAGSVVSLPMFRRLALADVDRVVAVVRSLHDRADEVAASLAAVSHA